MTTDKVCVCLDASVLHGDYALDRARLIRLLALAFVNGADVVIPKVVHDELCHQHRDELAKLRKELDAAAESAKRLLVFGSSPAMPQPSEDYERLSAARIAELGIGVRHYPTLSHESIVARFYGGLRPMTCYAKGKEHYDAGYKDLLIWHTVLELLGEGYSRVVLVSGNTRDFGAEGTSGLHADLLKDVREAGHGEEAVCLCTTLDEAAALLETLLGGRLKVDEEVADALMASVDFDQLLQQNGNRILDAVEPDRTVAMWGEGANSFWFGWDIEDAVVEVSEVEVLTEGDLLVHASASFSNEIEYCMFYSDYCLESDALEAAGMSLYEADEDSDIAWVGGDVTVRVEFGFVFNHVTRRISGFDVEAVRVKGDA